MYLEHLSLKNYRLFDSISIDFHNRLTVLVGDNGAGKTTSFECMDGLAHKTNACHNLYFLL